MEIAQWASDRPPWGRLWGAGAQHASHDAGSSSKLAAAFGPAKSIGLLPGAQPVLSALVQPPGAGLHPPAPRARLASALSPRKHCLDMQTCPTVASSALRRPPLVAAPSAAQRHRCLRVQAQQGFSGGQGQKLPKQVKVSGRAAWASAVCCCKGLFEPDHCLPGQCMLLPCTQPALLPLAAPY